MIVTQEFLAKLLDPFDTKPLECDGLTRVIATVLSRENIPYKAFVGLVGHVPTRSAFAPHFWLVVEVWTIDYRARMWLGQRDDIPHGVFQKEEFPIEYDGEEIFLDPLSDIWFQVLTEALLIRPKSNTHVTRGKVEIS